MLESAIGQDAAQKQQLDSDLQQHGEDRVAAKNAATYAKESATLKTNIAGLGDAIASVEKGSAGFLQTNMAKLLRDLSVTLDMSSVDRQLLSSFLSTRQGSRMSPAMGSINGILKGMVDDMKKDLQEATDNENAAIQAFEELVAIKNKEI